MNLHEDEIWSLYGWRGYGENLKKLPKKNSVVGSKDLQERERCYEI